GPCAGQMGRQRDPWLIDASAYEPAAYGAFPEYEFDHQERPYRPRRRAFHLPNLSLPEGVAAGRFGDRLALLRHLDAQRAALERTAEAARFDRFHQGAAGLLTHARVRAAFD